MHAPSISTSTLLLCLSLAACQVHAQPMRRQNEDVNIPGEVKMPSGVSIDDVNFETLVALATSIGIDGSVVTSLAGEIPTGILNTGTATTATTGTATGTNLGVLPTTTDLDATETASWDLLPTSAPESKSTNDPKNTNSRTSTGTTSTSTSSASTSTSTSDNDNAALGKAAMSSSLLVGFTAVLGGVLAGIVVTL